MRSILVWLVVSLPFAAMAQPVLVHVDANSNRHAISPFIYGVAYGSSPELADLNATINRYGGNPASRYNWLINASNRSDDFFYESIGDSGPVPGSVSVVSLDDQLRDAARREGFLLVPERT
ncbi:MAG TPA: hypothetical protein VHL58_13605 [Thermoanaerobaculia bacterium]|nr:hypothetical protein [Thermoanaerobaculia bacterium]